MKFVTSQGDLDVKVEQLIVAGWTGRDRAAVDHHIEELAAIGVARPSQVPLYYRVGRSLLSQAPVIEVIGGATSGEVEPLLVQHEGTLWLGLGSDHTDRELEPLSVAKSKQLCPKPVSTELWRFDEVEPHLDALILRCHIGDNGAATLYQEGTLAQIRPLRELIEGVGLRDRSAMLCGTLGAIGGVRPARTYRMELVDPVLDRSLRLDYRVRPLAIVA